MPSASPTKIYARSWSFPQAEKPDTGKTENIKQQNKRASSPGDALFIYVENRSGKCRFKEIIEFRKRKGLGEVETLEEFAAHIRKHLHLGLCLDAFR